MRFAWNRATAERHGTDGPIAAAASTVAGELALGAVEVHAVDGRHAGWIATEGQRTSDWLNAHSEVPVLGLCDGDAELPADPPRGPVPETAMARDEIVWVLPPPLPPNRHLRLHRRRILVHLELDDYTVSGQVHVRPGADAVDQVLRGTRDLVPLTEVQVVSRTDPGDGFAVPVLIVNRIHVRRVVEDSAHMSGPVPEPVETLTVDGEVDPRIAWLVPEPAADVEADPTDETEPPVDEAPEASGADLLRSAAELLLETGVIDVVEFQSIRARIPTLPTD